MKYEKYQNIILIFKLEDMGRCDSTVNFTSSFKGVFKIE